MEKEIKIFYSKNWNDYELLDTGDREKIEKFGEYVFVIELAGDGRREALGEVLAKHAGGMKSRMLGSFDVK